MTDCGWDCTVPRSTFSRSLGQATWLKECGSGGRLFNSHEPPKTGGEVCWTVRINLGLDFAHVGPVSKRIRTQSPLGRVTGWARRAGEIRFLGSMSERISTISGEVGPHPNFSPEVPHFVSKFSVRPFFYRTTGATTPLTPATLLSPTLHALRFRCNVHLPVHSRRRRHRSSRHTV